MLHFIQKYKILDLDLSSNIDHEGEYCNAQICMSFFPLFITSNSLLDCSA